LLVLRFEHDEADFKGFSLEIDRAGDGLPASEGVGTAGED
jgi:hypothetical protein